MANNRYVILAADPDENEWSILLQTNDVDQALDFWADQPDDPSQRVMLDMTMFINFPPPVTKANDDEVGHGQGHGHE